MCLTRFCKNLITELLIQLQTNTAVLYLTYWTYSETFTANTNWMEYSLSSNCNQTTVSLCNPKRPHAIPRQTLQYYSIFVKAWEMSACSFVCVSIMCYKYTSVLVKVCPVARFRWYFPGTEGEPTM